MTKLNASGALVYSTYLGGTSDDRGYGIAVDTSGNAYVTGGNIGGGFPTLNAFQGAFGGGDSYGGDAFVTKLSASGALVYSTYLGGTGEDGGYGIAVDGSGNASVTGYTASTNFPTRNAFQPTYGGVYDVFVAKFTFGSPPPLILNPTTLPATGVNAPYSQPITATGGTAPYSYAVTSGVLPPGLTLATNGALSGTPTTVGSYSFTVTATDSTGNTGSRMYTLVVAVPNPTPAPAPTRAPIGNPNVAPATHPPAAAVGVGTPTPLPQPVRH